MKHPDTVLRAREYEIDRLRRLYLADLLSAERFETRVAAVLDPEWDPPLSTCMASLHVRLAS